MCLYRQIGKVFGIHKLRNLAKPVTAKLYAEENLLPNEVLKWIRI